MPTKNLWFTIKNYKFNSIFFKNFLVIALLVILPVSFIGGLFYTHLERTLREEMQAANQSDTYRARDVMDTILNESRLLAHNISLRQEVENFMLFNNPGLFFENFDTRIADYIKSYTLVFGYYQSVYIYSEKNGGLISNSYNGTLEQFSDHGWLERYWEAQQTEPLIFHRTDAGSKRPYITILKACYNGGDKVGAVVLNLKVDELIKVIRSYNDFSQSRLFLTAPDGTVLLSDPTQYVGKQWEEIAEEYGGGEKYLTSAADSVVFELQYTTYQPERIAKEQMGNLKLVIVFTIIACFFLILIISYFISVRTFRPMQEILFTIDQPEQLWEEPSSDPEKLDEMRYIIANIKRMMKTNRETKKELGQRLHMLNKAHYAMLQSQINPHFLYNTLESINWIVRRELGYQNEASQTIDTLARLFRLSTQTEHYLISLKGEIEYTRRYLDILKIRYRDAFEAEWEIDQQLMDAKVVKLCMQPLVENAVYHGIKELEQPGQLTIQIARQHPGDMVITIADNGVGISPPQLAELRAKLTKPVGERFGSTGRHIGLVNVDERVKILFGDEYGVTVESAPGRGTAVSIRLPYITMDIEEQE